VLPFRQFSLHSLAKTCLTQHRTTLDRSVGTPSPLSSRNRFRDGKDRRPHIPSGKLSSGRGTWSLSCSLQCNTAVPKTYSAEFRRSTLRLVSLSDEARIPWLSSLRLRPARAVSCLCVRPAEQSGGEVLPSILLRQERKIIPKRLRTQQQRLFDTKALRNTKRRLASRMRGSRRHGAKWEGQLGANVM
jgi:hypothetical protein